MLAERGLGGSVELPGPVHDEAKWDFLRQAAVLTLPSWTEGQPYVILEALACGTPVVATRVGAIPESIDDGVEGFLVGLRDATALAQRLGDVLADPGLRSQMGRAARRRFERDFSTETFARNLGTVWRNVLARKAATSRPDPAARTAGGKS
jgi:glycosyltransferase involved in cell wall biosynthesis